MALDDALNLYSIKDSEAAGLIAYIPDLHVATDALSEVATILQERANGRDSYMVLSDIDEKKDRMELARQVGLPTREDIIFSSVAQDLNEDERDIFQYLFVMDMHGGIENYTRLVQAQMPDVDIKKEIERYDDTVKKYQERGLDVKVQEILGNKQDALREQILQTKIASMAFDRAISQYNLDKVAKEIEKINNEAEEKGLGKIKIIAGGGNHDTEYDVEYLQSKLGEDVVYNAHRLQGAIEIGDSEDMIRFQLASNCYGISQHFDKQAYSDEEEAALYPHMRLEKALVQNFTADQLDNISEQVSLRSYEYQRMFAGEEKDANLDFLLLHEEVGEKLGYEGSPYADVDSAGVLYAIANRLDRNEEGLTRVYSGHLHGEATKDFDDWGMTKFRNYATLIDKGGEEILNIASKHPKLDYDLATIKTLFEREYEVLADQYTKLQSNSQSSQAA